MLLKYLGQIKDPRRAQGKRYQLEHILLFSILAILSGARSYRDVSRFMNKRWEKFNEVLRLDWKRGLSKTQLRDIFCSLDVGSVELAFRTYSHGLSKIILCNEPNEVGVDGKHLRGSFCHEEPKPMLQLLAAFCSKSPLILGHVDIEEKTNEIPTAQALIKAMELPENSIYSADALHCQKKLLKPPLMRTCS